MSHKTAVLVKPGHILQRKCPAVFPLMPYDCFLSAELGQSSCTTSEGKLEDIFSVKYDPVLLKVLLCGTYWHALLSFIFEAAGCGQSYVLLL